MREIDDLQPRIQIKEVVKEDDLSLDNEESMEKFSKSYIVERPLVIKCLKQPQKRIFNKHKNKSLFQKLKSVRVISNLTGLH